MRSRSIDAGVLSGRGLGATLLFMLLVLALPASAFAQATRSWVSGVGDDTNPCSRTAPCKTWAGAISKTAAGGEIDALDPGGYGALTITKSITIDGGGGQVASTLVAGTDGMVVNAASTDRVILRNLRFQGLAGNGGNLGNSGQNGIRFLAGAVLRLEHVRISGFARNGVLDITSAPSRMIISNSSITDNFGDGVLVAPGTASTAFARAVVEQSSLETNACGLVVSTLGTGAGTCGVGTSQGAGGSTVNVWQSVIAVNDNDGVFADGTRTKSFLTGDLITGNGTGLAAANSGQNIFLCGDALAGNTSDGSPTSSITTNCS